MTITKETHVPRRTDRFCYFRCLVNGSIEETSVQFPGYTIAEFERLHNRSVESVGTGGGFHQVAHLT